VGLILSGQRHASRLFKIVSGEAAVYFPLRLVITQLLNSGSRINRAPLIAPAQFVIVLLGIWFGTLSLWRQYQNLISHPIANLSHPAATAMSIVHADMFLWQGSAIVPSPTRVFPSLSGWLVEDLPQYDEELLRETIAYLQADDHNAHDIRKLRAMLAVILAETGSKPAAWHELELLSKDSTLAPFARAARAIYTDERPDPALDRTNVCSVLSTYWPRWEFEMRWLLLTKENRTRATTLSQWQREQAKTKFYQLAVLCGTETGLLVLGLWLFVRLRLRRVAPEEPLVPWSAWEGWGMFLGTIAIGELLWAITSHLLPFSILDVSYNLITCGGILLFLWLRYGSGSTPFWNVFALNQPASRWPFLIATSLTIFALDSAGMMALNPLLDLAGIENHWTDYHKEADLYAQGPMRVGVLMNSIVWAPIFEELLFRGVLYSALRQKFSVAGSTIFSALIFTAGHYYSPHGLIEMLLFGIWTALAFELTRSLLPCIIAHILTNLFATGGAVVLYGL
jgi:uncharacterized protein